VKKISMRPHRASKQHSGSKQPVDTSAAQQPHGAGNYSGNPADYLLTRHRVAGIANGGAILITWANHHYLDFAVNWVNHMHQLNITAYMVGAMDDDLLKALVERGEQNTFAMQSDLDKKDLGWGSSQFHKMGRLKIHLVMTINSMGFDIIVSDIDASWLKDPFPYIARYPDADILTSSDHLSNTSNSDGLEVYPDAGSSFNIGIIFLRKTCLKFSQEWNENLQKDAALWDQNVFNELLRLNFNQHNGENRRDDRLVKGYDGQLLFGILPVALFASGHTFYFQDLANTMGLEPYVAHNTFQFSGTPGKRHRFRERMIWLADDAAYYDPPGGLLSFDMHISEYLEPASHLDLDPAKPIQLENFHAHFALVNAQLVQLRNAMAISYILGRTLVLPQLFSGADRWWAPHHGVIPGATRVELPRVAPADFILDLERMDGDLRAAGSQTGIAFRESSFLGNRNVPQSVRTSRLEVSICKDGETCSSDKGHQELVLKSRYNDTDLLSIFEEYKDKKILHFKDMRAGFGGFSSAEDASRFANEIKVYTSIWCCVNGPRPGLPGHVWYDIWWDQPNHVDRHNRLFGDVWVPVTGP